MENPSFEICIKGLTPAQYQKYLKQYGSCKGKNCEWYEECSKGEFISNEPS